MGGGDGDGGGGDKRSLEQSFEQCRSNFCCFLLLLLCRNLPTGSENRNGLDEKCEVRRLYAYKCKFQLIIHEESPSCCPLWSHRAAPFVEFVSTENTDPRLLMMDQKDFR